MGYESRIIIVDRHEFAGSGEEPYIFAEEIARVELCKMGYSTNDGMRSFCDIFKTPIDFNLYGMAERWEYPDKEYPDEHYREDCYGAVCKYATIDEVKTWLENAKDGYEPALNYRRAQILYGLLTTLKANESKFDNLLVVHYGH